jgi:hypothetical protein
MRIETMAIELSRNLMPRVAPSVPARSFVPVAAAVPAPIAAPTDRLALSSVTRLALPATGGGLTFDDYEADRNLPLPSEDPIGGSATQPTIRRGDDSPAVRTLQEKLKANGFDPGAADGDFGPKTEAALKAFQRAKGLEADGVAGPRTWAALGETGTAAPTPGASSGDARGRLLAGLTNRYKGARHQCFRYAWTTVARAGGKGIGQAAQSREGRGNGTAHLEAMVANGQVRLGDIIYVNRRPGADPTSRNLAYGPHWMVYIGQGQFADQYGVRDAKAMAAFVPGRKIDTIYHTM